jgi:carbon storage regulator
MLVISRKKDEQIIVAGEIEITILQVGRNRVRFGIKAPKHVPIHTRMRTGAPLSTETAETGETPEAAVTPSVASEGVA